MHATLNPLAPVPPTGIATYGAYRLGGPRHGDPTDAVLARQEARKDSITALISGAAPPEPRTALRKQAPVHSRVSAPGYAGAPYGLTGVNTPAFSPSTERQDGLVFSRGAKGSTPGRGRYLDSILRSDNVAALIIEAGGGGSAEPSSAASRSSSTPAPPVYFPPDERGTAYVPPRTTPLAKPTDAGKYGWGGGSHGRGGGAEFKAKREAALYADGVASLLRQEGASEAASATPPSNTRTVSSSVVRPTTAGSAYVSPMQQERPVTSHTSRRHGANTANDPYKPTSIY
jgi:hypothetical protein